MIFFYTHQHQHHTQAVYTSFALGTAKCEIRKSGGYTEITRIIPSSEHVISESCVYTYVSVREIVCVCVCV